MKIMFASDIHGSAYFCKKMLEVYEIEQAQRLVLLGDLLYHGPRNPLPKEYDPKKVIDLLNSYKNDIYAVRGNCDAEVDQMVLKFPIMADYAVFFMNDKCIYASHGHLASYENLPPMKKGDIFIQGHTHVLRADKLEHAVLLNPGSVALPKENHIPTYGIIDESGFIIKGLDGQIVKQLTI